MIIIGAMCFSNLVEMKSAPELILGFNCLQISKISISEILEKVKELGFSFWRKLSKFMSEGPISAASSGPIPVKKVLKPFTISRQSVIISPLC